MFSASSLSIGRCLSLNLKLEMYLPWHIHMLRKHLRSHGVTCVPYAYPVTKAVSTRGRGRAETSQST